MALFCSSVSVNYDSMTAFMKLKQLNGILVHLSDFPALPCENVLYQKTLNNDENKMSND